MWALDLLNDTILMALLPSFTVLVGSMILLGLHWPQLGLVILVGTIVYVSMTLAFSVRFIAPAARVSNAWDTKVGGTLADAMAMTSCGHSACGGSGRRSAISSAKEHTPAIAARNAVSATGSMAETASRVAGSVPPKITMPTKPSRRPNCSR